MSIIEQGRADVILAKINEQFSHHLSGIWEDLCRTYITKGGMGQQFSNCQPWWGKLQDGTPIEIDGVSLSRDKKELLLLECKWSNLASTELTRQRLLRLAPQLPFYRGESITVAVAEKHIEKTQPKDITPALVLNKLM